MNLPNNSPLALVKELLKDAASDWEDRLKDINTFKELEKIYSLPYRNIEKNLIAAFIILAYDYQSSMIEIRRDRADDKERILKNIAPNLPADITKKIISGKEKTVSECGFNYCMSRKNWKFYAALQLLEQSSDSMRYAREATDDEITTEEKDKEGNKTTFTSDIDPEKVAKIRQLKTNILEKAIAQRRQADEIIEEIKKEYAPIEKVMEDEFDFQLTAAENFDIECWADHIRRRNDKKEKQLKLSQDF